MNGKTPTLAEISKALGISRSTVSNALTGNRHVSPTTKQKVLEHVERIGYQPNVFAQGLRTKRTRVVGVMVSDMSEPFLGLLVRCIEEALKAKHWEMLLGSYYFDCDEEKRLLQTLERYMVEGIITLSGTADLNSTYEAISQRSPVVFVYRNPFHLDIASVTTNYRSIGYQSVKYLYTKGHRNIVHVGLPEEYLTTQQEEIRGFVEAHRRLGIPLRKEQVILRPQIRLHEIRESIKLANLIVEKKATAVCGLTDYIAVGLLRGFHQIGVRVPEDISILSKTNVDYGLSTWPTLTSIDMSPSIAARKAVGLISKMTRSKDSKRVKYEVPFSIVERESVRQL